MNTILDYDEFIYKAAPNYGVALRKLINHLPRDINQIVNLGTSTGNLEKQIFSKKPDLKIIGYDINEGDMSRAIQKLQGYDFEGFSGENGDITKISKFPKTDCVISSLTFHHLEDDDKIQTWEKIYNSLKPNGVFINYDIVKATSQEEHKDFLNYVVSNMRRNKLPDDFIKDEINIVNGHGPNADKPMTYERQKKELNRIGFKVEQQWANKLFRIYTAIKE